MGLHAYLFVSKHDTCLGHIGGLARLAIESFGSGAAKAIFEGRDPGKGFPADLVRATKRKLEMLEAAPSLDALRIPPSNRLEALKGDYSGWLSIRINDQFRLIFRWTAGGASDVTFIDYH